MRGVHLHLQSKYVWRNLICLKGRMTQTDRSGECAVERTLVYTTSAVEKHVDQRIKLNRMRRSYAMFVWYGTATCRDHVQTYFVPKIALEHDIMTLSSHGMTGGRHDAPQNVVPRGGLDAEGKGKGTGFQHGRSQDETDCATQLRSRYHAE